MALFRETEVYDGRNSECEAIVESVNGSVALVRNGKGLFTALNPFPQLKVGDRVVIFRPEYGLYYGFGQREIVQIKK